VKGAFVVGRFCEPAVFVSLFLCAVPLHLAFADEPSRADLGAKIWYADNGQEHALLGGAVLSAKLLRSVEVEGEFLQGDFHNEGDVETHRYFEGECRRRFRYGYAGAGFSYRQVNTELKPGWVWDDDRPEREERNADIYGPYLAAGLQGPLFCRHLKWRLSTAWMFKDFGELDDLGYDGSHASVEAGLEVAFKKLFLSLGYRYERYRDLPPRLSNGVASDRNVMEGPFSTAGVRF